MNIGAEFWYDGKLYRVVKSEIKCSDAGSVTFIETCVPVNAPAPTVSGQHRHPAPEDGEDW